MRKKFSKWYNMILLHSSPVIIRLVNSTTCHFVCYLYWQVSYVNILNKNYVHMRSNSSLKLPIPKILISYFSTIDYFVIYSSSYRYWKSVKRIPMSRRYRLSQYREFPYLTDIGFVNENYKPTEIKFWIRTMNIVKFGSEIFQEMNFCDVAL